MSNNCIIKKKKSQKFKIKKEEKKYFFQNCYFAFINSNFPWKVYYVHLVYTHVHPSKGNHNKDAEKNSNSFDIDLFYNPLHVRLRIVYIINILVLRNINIRRAIL